MKTKGNIFTTLFGILFAASGGVAQTSAPGSKVNTIASLISTISGSLGLIFARDASNKP